MVDCANCGKPIRRQSETDTCGGRHDDYPDPVLLHVDCSCPVHGWDAERAGYAQDEFVFDDDTPDPENAR